MAFRDCEHCERVLYDERTGRPKLDVQGKEVPRPRHMKPPCGTCPKVPRSVKETRDLRLITKADAVNLTERSLATIQYYRECRAVGEFPADPLVRHFAAVLRDVEDRQAREEVTDRLDQILSVLPLVGVSRG